MTSWLRCKSLLRRCLPDQPPVPLREKLLSGLLAAAALVLMGLIKEGYPLAFNDILLASMGATAVLLYATPHSPLVQPSAVVVGHLLSALVGILAHHWVPAPFAAGLAVGGAIIAMHLFGCLHPPGGATALYAVSGGPLIWELDYDYVLRPVGMSAVLMVLIGVFINRLRPGLLHYPAPLPHSSPAPIFPSETTRATRHDIRTVMHQTRSFIDVNEEDLWVLFQHVEHLADQRFLANHTVRDLKLEVPQTLYLDTPVSEVWPRLLGTKSSALMVIDEASTPHGIITPTDAMKLLANRLAPTPNSSPDLLDQVTASDLMSHPVKTVQDSESLHVVARLLAEGEIHHVPVVDAKGFPLGIITHADLWSQLTFDTDSADCQSPPKDPREVEGLKHEGQSIRRSL